MKPPASLSHASLYLVGSRLGLARIGVAPDPHQRLRELQVGSPVKLELAPVAPYQERQDACAVADELCRQFAPRRAHGSWYRVTAAEVSRALASRTLRDAPAAREARFARRPGRGARPRTENYQRRRRRARAAKQKRAAKLLARKLKRVEVATALGVTTRTLRNWSAAPDFIRRLERERERLERAEADGARPRVSSRGRGGQAAPAPTRRLPPLPLGWRFVRRGELTPAELRAREHTKKGKRG